MSFFGFFQKKKVTSSASSTSPTIGIVIKNDIQHFYDNPGAESVKQICDTLITALAEKEYYLSVPIDFINIEKNECCYLMLNHEQLGKSYKAYTGLAGYGIDAGCPMAVTSVLTLFEHIARDTASGLVFDHKCGHDSNVILSREEIFKILFAVQYLRKSKLKNAAKILDDEFVFAEKGLIYRNVDLAIEKCLVDQGSESHTILCQQLVYAVLYNISYRVATTESTIAPVYAVYQHEQVGPVYMLFTNMESAVLHSKHPSGFTKIRTIFDHTITDNVNGILLNGSIFLSKENIQSIIKYGYEQIELQPPEKKKFMLEKM